MKITASHTNTHQYKNSLSQNNEQAKMPRHEKDNVSFGFSGIAGAPVAIMDTIARGGVCATFCIQDFFGLICPRIATGFFRNKDITHEYNYAEAAEVSIREIATGPPMFIIPMVGLAMFKRFIGKACDVPTDFIKGLGHIYQGNVALQDGSAEALKRLFYPHVISEALKNATNGELEGDALKAKTAEFLDAILKIEDSKPKSIWKKIRNIEMPESSTDKMGALVNKFVELGKQHTEKAASADFHSAKLVVKGEPIKCTFEQLLAHMKNFTEDMANVVHKNGTGHDIVSKFVKNRVVMRNTTNAALMLAVIAFCLKIPSMYQLHKVNPGLKGLIDDNEPANNRPNTIKTTQAPVVSKPLIPQCTQTAAALAQPAPVTAPTVQYISIVQPPNVNVYLAPFKAGDLLSQCQKAKEEVMSS